LGTRQCVKYLFPVDKEIWDSLGAIGPTISKLTLVLKGENGKFSNYSVGSFDRNEFFLFIEKSVVRVSVNSLAQTLLCGTQTHHTHLTVNKQVQHQT
jgi:hypothetical protein